MRVRCWETAELPSSGKVHESSWPDHEAGATNMKSLDLITRVGPVTSRPARGPDTTIPFRIEVEMGNGPEIILSVSPSATAELRAELNLYLQTHGLR
jgi:hypothetical protein